MLKNKTIYKVYEDYVEGVLHDGTSFFIDLDDFELVNNKSVFMKQGYIGIQRSKLLHRVIMQNQLKEGLTVDHINRNKLDNRKSNLRVVTQQENQLNRTMQKNNKSGHTGVHWDNKANKWRAMIRRNHKLKHIGFYETKEEAIKARREAEQS